MGSSTGRRRLLVVEDEAQIRSLMSQILTALGHEVRAAEDGLSALKEIRESTPDIILSDLNMPGMSGFELLSVVRRRLPGIYVIATSGAYAGSDIPRGIAADAYYAKASGIQALVSLLSQALEADPTRDRGDAESTPIWICRESEEKHLVINCPECLRNSLQASPDTIQTIHRTTCHSCGSVIHYAIIRPMGAEASQANLQGLSSIAPKRRAIAPPIRTLGF
ncbi:Response regulator receiver domain-containing protein [Granulicella rosea]|uniref:Response regulator receiver domain-containing protein n=1 Tax=Granulicella rosea TaxID=474952 RepID=A0A239GSW5_9BACT|nr:response regulator [Granulicella rosea]SNS72051.1 Response regulator receiver domain-containing protein [Granulicella rosea]